MQRSAVTEYIVSDLIGTFAAEETAARVLADRIVKLIKKNVQRQQCFEFIVPMYMIGYKPYDVSRCTSILTRVLRQNGLRAKKIGIDVVYVEIDIDLKKLLRKYENTISSSISSELAYDYEKIGLITQKEKELIYAKNRMYKKLSYSAPFSGYSSTVPVEKGSGSAPSTLEDAFGGMTLDELFKSSDPGDTESVSGDKKSAPGSRRLYDFYDI